MDIGSQCMDYTPMRINRQLGFCTTFECYFLNQ